MGLGPPSCDDCRVMLYLYMGERWLCPVCDKEPPNGYRHLRDGKIIEDSNIPLLRFLKGKSPHPDK